MSPFPFPFPFPFPTKRMNLFYGLLSTKQYWIVGHLIRIEFLMFDRMQLYKKIAALFRERVRVRVRFAETSGLPAEFR